MPDRADAPGEGGERAKPRSGKILVRIPKSLHSHLAAEAAREGVSLNQLMVAKLSIPLSDRLSHP